MIKLLADENIPIEAVEALRRKGIDIIPVLEVSPSLSDRAVLELANGQGRVIVSFDKDFGGLVFKEKLKAKGLVLVGFTSASPQHVAKRNEYLFSKDKTLRKCNMGR